MVGEKPRVIEEEDPLHETEPFMAKKKTGVTIPGLKMQTVTVSIEGLSPLVVHRMSEKSRRQMSEKKSQLKTKGRQKCDPEQEYMDALYWLTEQPKKK